MLQSVAAVVAGFVAMAVIVMIGSMAIVAVMLPGGLAAMRNNPAGAVSNHLAALAAVVVAMGLLSARMTRGTHQPQWYKVLIPLIGVAGVSISAMLLSVR